MARAYVRRDTGIKHMLYLFYIQMHSYFCMFEIFLFRTYILFTTTTIIIIRKKKQIKNKNSHIWKRIKLHTATWIIFSVCCIGVWCAYVCSNSNNIIIFEWQKHDHNSYGMSERLCLGFFFLLLSLHIYILAEATISFQIIHQYFRCDPSSVMMCLLFVHNNFHHVRRMRSKQHCGCDFAIETWFHPNKNKNFEQ